MESRPGDEVIAKINATKDLAENNAMGFDPVRVLIANFVAAAPVDSRKKDSQKENRLVLLLDAAVDAQNIQAVRMILGYPELSNDSRRAAVDRAVQLAETLSDNGEDAKRANLIKREIGGSYLSKSNAAPKLSAIERASMLLKVVTADRKATPYDNLVYELRNIENEYMKKGLYLEGKKQLDSLLKRTNTAEPKLLNKAADLISNLQAMAEKGIPGQIQSVIKDAMKLAQSNPEQAQSNLHKFKIEHFQALSTHREASQKFTTVENMIGTLVMRSKSLPVEPSAKPAMAPPSPRSYSSPPAMGGGNNNNAPASPPAEAGRRAQEGAGYKRVEGRAAIVRPAATVSAHPVRRMPAASPPTPPESDPALTSPRSPRKG